MGILKNSSAERTVEHAENAETLNGCGCATRVGYVNRKTIDETNSATVQRKTLLYSLCGAKLGIINNCKTGDKHV